jgi:asparagine synthase (glutamine-hydrolysing)
LNGPGQAADLVDELESLLSQSVRGQLVADVPVGVLLSGGLDSSLVTALASRVTSDLHTFTIRFPGHGSFDETEHARLIARAFSTNHVELDGHDVGPDVLPLLVRQFDEPIVDSSMIPTYLVTKLVRAHSTVALGGDGGDELFGGYGHYSHLLQLEGVVRAVPKAVRRGIASLAQAAMPVGTKGRHRLQQIDVELRTELPVASALFDAPMRARLLGPRRPDVSRAESIRRDRQSANGDLVQRATRTDFSNYLADGVLVKLDRASMLNSLEMRAPFLDVRVMEFAFRRVPSRLKATRNQRKILLHQLAARLLPAGFAMGRKQGLSVPLATWLRMDAWASSFRDVLLGPENTLFDRTVVSGLLDGHQRGRSNSERLFALMMCELWRREFSVEVPSAA